MEDLASFITRRVEQREMSGKIRGKKILLEVAGRGLFVTSREEKNNDSRTLSLEEGRGER